MAVGAFHILGEVAQIWVEQDPAVLLLVGVHFLSSLTGTWCLCGVVDPLYYTKIIHILTTSSFHTMHPPSLVLNLRTTYVSCIRCLLMPCTVRLLMHQLRDESFIFFPMAPSGLAIQVLHSYYILATHASVKRFPDRQYKMLEVRSDV